MRLLTALMFCAGTAAASPVKDIMAAAQNSFAGMPQLQEVAHISGNCGADTRVNPVVAYCTSDNLVLLRSGAASEPQTAYKLAHVLGHAVQVRHGVADVALRMIRARPEDEAALRGMVTRQVECIAGFLLARAGHRVDMTELFSEEPMADAHWGRNPLAHGPVVSIGLDARAEWVVRGQQAETLTACAVGEMSADLLLRAYRG